MTHANPNLSTVLKNKHRFSGREPHHPGIIEQWLRRIGQQLAIEQSVNYK